MQQEHKKRIQNTFQRLINECKVESLLHYFRNKDIFTDDMIKSIKDVAGKDKNRKFFLDIQTRGPKAFETLIHGLIDTNQRPLAELLDTREEFIPKQRTRNEFSGPRPFTLPNYVSTEAIKELHDLHPTFNINLTEEPLKVTVKRSENFDHCKPGAHRSPVYYTRSKNRGLVKIINMYNVEKEKPRIGSEFDVINLKSLFEQMGMTVDVSEDLTAAEIKDELLAYVKDIRLKTADIAVLVIMSHGGVSSTFHEYFYGKDHKEVSTNYVENLFSNQKCAYMQNKPKLIIYQICRGIVKDFGVKPRSVETDSAVNHNLPSISDILIVHSTLKDYKAHRDTYIGAWFIQLLCEVFMKYAYNTHIEEMLKITHTLLRKQISGENTMQTPEAINRAFNVCYFNPGIYMENEEICHFDTTT